MSSPTVERVNERVKTLDAVLEGHAMTIAVLEGRVKALEFDLTGFDPHQHEPMTVAQLHATISVLQKQLMDALVRCVAKRIPNLDDEPMRPLPELTDRTSRHVYIAEVTQRLAAQRISATEARTLLYAAQLHMTGGQE